MGRARGRHYHGDFESLSFPKSGAEIIENAKVIRNRLNEMIKEREERIRVASKEAGLETGADVLFSLKELDYGLSNTAGGLTAGLAGKIQKEVGARRSEKDEVEKLDTVIHNLPREGKFELTFAELDYFEF